MADFAIFADLFELVDEQTMHFATEIPGRAVTAISPIVVVGLTLAFIMHGLLIVRGMVDSPLMEFLGRDLSTGHSRSELSITMSSRNSKLADAPSAIASPKARSPVKYLPACLKMRAVILR